MSTSAFRHTVGGHTYQFPDLQALMARATPLRSGDLLAGVAAGSARERVAAQMALAEVPLTRFLSEALVPYEEDEVTRLIVDTHDATAFAPVRHLTVGDFRNWLLSDVADSAALAALAPGITPEMAKAAVRRSNTLIAALSVRLGYADGMLCGLVGRYEQHLDHVGDVIGRRSDARHYAALNALMLDPYTLFIADTFVNEDPDAETLAEIAAMSAETVRQFGLEPRVAFLSHSMYGSSHRASARKMRAARDLFVRLMPGVQADGEMQGDAALSEEVRASFLPANTLAGSANVLICPNLDAANILFNVLKMTGGHGITVGPILLGAAAPVHILTPSATVRRVVNMTALAVAGGR